MKEIKVLKETITEFAMNIDADMYSQPTSRARGESISF
jgi:hypothetical protein